MTQEGGKYISRNRSVIFGELANCVPMKNWGFSRKYGVLPQHYQNLTTALPVIAQTWLFFLRFSANITKNIPIHYGNITK